jgi:Ca-activated chloride channel homolog
MRKRIALPLRTLCLLVVLAGCGQAVSPPQDQKGPTRQDPKKETVYALKGNWPARGDETQKQEVAANLLAKNFVLVYDGSGSMSETKCAGKRKKIEVARDAVSEWVRTVPHDANVGLISFHEDRWSKLPPAARNREEFVKIIHRIAPGGGTPLAQAVNRAYAMLRDQALQQLGYGEYTIVVVTDGEANDIPALAAQVNTVLDESPVVINTVGFCIAEKHSLNQPGRTVYKAANNPEELRKGLQEVLAEAETFDVPAFK